MSFSTDDYVRLEDGYYKIKVSNKEFYDNCKWDYKKEKGGIQWMKDNGFIEKVIS